MIPTNKTDNVLVNKHRVFSQSDLTEDRPLFIDNNPSLIEPEESVISKARTPAYNSAEQHLFLKIEEQKYHDCEGKFLHNLTNKI